MEDFSPLCRVVVAFFGILWTSCHGYGLSHYHQPGLSNIRGVEEDNMYLIPINEVREDRLLSKRQSPSAAEVQAIMSGLTPEKIKELIQSGEFRYLALLERPQTTFTPRIGRRKRSLDYDQQDEDAFLESRESEESDDRVRLLHVLPPNLRRRGENVKTIHLQSSFIPRLGKKRSGEVQSAEEDSNGGARRVGAESGGINGRSQHVINLSAGSAFTPRLGRSYGRLSRSGRSVKSDNSSHLEA